MSNVGILSGVSKGEINRSGEKLANAWINSSVDPAKHSDADLRHAYAIVSAYRTAHQSPMGRVAMGVRSMVRTATGEQPLVSQRLKRVPRIVRKIARMGQQETTLLARLEDIGGCRAVIETPAEVEAVRRRIEENWGDDISRRRDYVAAPSPIGYRALHFTVPRDGLKIEVQLRTRGQQTWANAIEQADSRLGLTLKDGVGPESMIEYFAAIGSYIYHQEYGLTIPTELIDRVDAATDLVVSEGYYTRRASA